MIALVVGGLLVLTSLGLVGGGGTALWVHLTQRDDAGYVTTGVHEFSTSGSALATEPARLDSPGVGWLYSAVALGEVRIRITPTDPNANVFVGIGPAADVDRYLGGVAHTHIADFWSESVQQIPGGAPSGPPSSQSFWAASVSGTGAQTLTWDPASGSWSVVVMNADGRAGVDVGADLGATFPALLPVAVGSLVAGVLFLIVGAVLIVVAVRRRRAGIRAS